MSCLGLLTIYETKMSFLKSLIRITVLVIELELGPHFCFLHAMTSGMCHHAQLKVHAPPHPWPSVPRLPGFLENYFSSLGFNHSILSDLRFYLVSTHFHINEAPPSSLSLINKNTLTSL